MKTLLTVSVLVYSLLFFAAPSSACSAFPDAHIGKVLEIDQVARRVTISDAETGSPVTFTVDENALLDIELAVLSIYQSIFVRYRVEGDQLIATEIKRLN
jgi:hypothetical protein